MSNNDTSLLVFRFGERVEELKKSTMSQWPEIRPEAMGFFAGEILASGVVLWALMNQTGLDTMRWPGDLPVVLGLKISSGSETKIGQALNTIAEAVGLMGAETDSMKMVFLELLQWSVVEQLHAGLFTGQRQELAKILGQENFSATDRSVMLVKTEEFLKSAGIYAFDAQNYFEKALKKSLQETFMAFEDKISVEKKAEIIKEIS